jgi:hypothetical protein
MIISVLKQLLWIILTQVFPGVLGKRNRITVYFDFKQYKSEPSGVSVHTLLLFVCLQFVSLRNIYRLIQWHTMQYTHTGGITCLQDNNVSLSVYIDLPTSSFQSNEIELNLLRLWQLAVRTGRAPVWNAWFSDFTTILTQFCRCFPNSTIQSVCGKCVLLLSVRGLSYTFKAFLFFFHFGREVYFSAEVESLFFF